MKTMKIKSRSADAGEEGMRLQQNMGGPDFRWLMLSLMPLILLALLGSVEGGRAAGQVVAWGNNDFGQTNVPSGLTNVIAVAAASSYSLALRNDGTVVAWCYNYLGVTNVPKRLTNVTAIAAGTTHSLALQKSGAIASWGDNTDGQTTVSGNLVNVIAIAAGHSHSLALQRDGMVVAWGDNTFGQTNVPEGLTNVVAIAAGTSHSLALRSDGTVAAWGANGSGQATVPQGLNDIVAIAAGGGHSLALRSNGTVVAWGSNEESQTSVPLGLSNVVSIAGGTWTSMALTEDGAVVMWGCCFLPGVQVGISNAIAISLGQFHALAIVDDGPPVVTVHPFSRSVFSGHELVLRVMAVGRPPLNYQWRWNGADLPGETNALLRLPAVQSGDGDTYLVVVRNVFGFTTSAPATLTVIQSPPFIITQPANQDFHLGDSFVLEVEADGSGPLEYQWWFNGALIAGATNATLSFSNARDNSRGVYTVTIQNSLGSITSHPLQLVLPIKSLLSG